MADRGKLVRAIILGVVGNSVIYLIPLLIGAMVSDRGFGDREAGLIASLELAGYAASTLASALILGRFSGRRIVLVGACLMVGANLGATMVHGREAFELMRFISGLGAGALAAIANVALGETDRPERNYGLLFASSLLFGTAGLWGLPLLLGRFGLNGAYWFIAMLALAAGAAPGRAFSASAVIRGEGRKANSAHRGSWLLAGTVLASVLFFWGQQNAVYAYLERIGQSDRLSPEFIGFTLGAANLAGFVGASMVVWTGNRLGRVAPLTCSLLVQLLCLGLLAAHDGALVYFASIALLALAWNVVNPFQLAILAGVDPSGKALALAATVTGAGLAAGPAAGALVIGIGGYRAILWLAALTAVSSVLLLLPVVRAKSYELVAG